MPDGDLADRPAGQEQVVPAQQVPDDVDAAGRAACAACGTTARAITWSLQVDRRGATWLCDVCTRRDLRSIEGRLDEAWW